MTQHTHQTAPTQFVNTAGVRFAYRRFGKSTGVPLVFNMHFTGTMDHWDPLVTNGLAATREVILFNNAGVSSSSGEVPSSAEEMAANAAAFIKALGPEKVDVLGFSLGGFVAQALAVAEPSLVRRLILVGTGPQGGQGMATLTPEAQAVFGAKYANPDEVWLGGLLHADRGEPSCRPGVFEANSACVRIIATRTWMHGSHRLKSERWKSGALRARTRSTIFGRLPNRRW